jgi:hypothetical protein
VKFDKERGCIFDLRHGQGMGVMTERRIARRYDLTLPISIRIPAEQELEAQAGKTRDISTRGLYFIVDLKLETGSELDITLTLPGELTKGSDVLVRALGKVLRVETHSEEGQEMSGVAAIIERYDIVRGDHGKI